MISRLSLWIAKLIVIFIALSIALVVLFRFVPVTFTATMLMDERSVTRDWLSLIHI